MPMAYSVDKEITMGLWASITERAQTVRDQAIIGAQWLWNNASPITVTKAVVKSRAVRFITNTSFHILDEVRALRKAIPTLIENPQAQVIMNSMGQLLAKDIIPLFTLHSLSNRIQDLINDENQAANPNSLVVTTLMLCSYLMLADYNSRQQRGAAKDASSVVTRMGYTLAQDVLPYVAVHVGANKLDSYLTHQSAEQAAWSSWLFYKSLKVVNSTAVNAYDVVKIAPATVRDSVINSFAPSAFNSNKTIAPPSLCIEHECNTQRKVKGMGRELGILVANEILIWGISNVPGVGSPLALVLTILNNGRFVLRAVTPERCERHKYMEQEFVLAIGSTYEFFNWAMVSLLTQYAGPLPALYVRILQHMLLQMHVNLAAHMDVPCVESKDATLVDVFDYYERGSRFFFDVLWTGLLKEVPKALKPKPNEPPVISLSALATAFVRLLNSDLERIEATKRIAKPNPVTQKLKDWVIPPMFRSSYDFMRDDVIADYWKDIREGGLTVFTSIEHYEKSKLVSTFAWREELASALAALLDYKFGFPAKLTKIALMLSKEEDFWKINHALKAYFDRHGPRQEGHLAVGSQRFLPLADDRGLEQHPSKTVTVDSAVAQQVVVAKSSNVSDVLDAERLMSPQGKIPVRPESLFISAPPKNSVVASPDSLFSTVRKRKTKTKVADQDKLFAADESETVEYSGPQ